ncbi:MAG: helix-turn-helix domain-containing protein [Thermoanaerobacterales bacterium]|nr:helix-turn-helix domain-containing protein [Thermoanaerobacterales bacterium]
MRCENPMKIIEILRLTEQGYSQKDIAKSVKCGKSTVEKFRSAAGIVISIMPLQP